MADYYAVLKRAIGGLPNPTGEARRGVYEKARTALVNQLKSFDPPLTASEITRQRLALEDCIRKVEAEAAKGSLAQFLGRQPEASPLATPAPRAPIEQPRAPIEQPARPMPPAEPTYEPRREPPRMEPPRAEPPRMEPPRLETPRPETPRLETPRAEPARPEPPRVEMPRAEPPRLDPVRREPTTARIEPPPPREPEPPRPPAPPSLSEVVRKTETMGTAAREAARQARELLGDKADEAGSRDGEPSMVDAAPTAQPPARGGRERLDEIVAEPAFAPLDDVDNRPRRSAAVVAVVVVLLVGLALLGLYTQRDAIRAMVGGDAPSRVDPAQPASAPNKNTDRLVTDTPAAPAADPNVRVVQTEPITAPTEPAPAPAEPAPTPAPTEPTPTPAPRAEAPPTLPAEPAPPPPAPPAPPAEPAPNGPVVSQRATLFEEGQIGSNQGVATVGQVTWAVVRDQPEANAQPETMLRARVEVPQRGLVAVITIRPNRDQALPASHLVELRFTVPSNFDGRGIQTVPGMILKEAENSRGDPLLGAPARITTGFFWIALATPPADRDRNVTLLRERGWIDIPLVYETGKRAILTLEKGAGGDRAVQDAIAAWAASGG